MSSSQVIFVVSCGFCRIALAFSISVSIEKCVSISCHAVESYAKIALWSNGFTKWNSCSINACRVSSIVRSNTCREKPGFSEIDTFIDTRKIGWNPYKCFDRLYILYGKVTFIPMEFVYSIWMFPL